MSLGLAASGTAGPLRAWRKPALQRIFESGDSLRLQFPREDLGFAYTAPGCAVLPDSRMAELEWSPPRLHNGIGALAPRHPSDLHWPLQTVAAQQPWPLLLPI